MKSKILNFSLALTLITMILLSAHVKASTFIRADLNYLTHNHSRIMVGTITDIRSYWNSSKTSMLSDVVILPSYHIKGESLETLTITVLGGTVNGLSTVIIGGADLVLGSEYVLFLEPSDLPDAKNVLTVREHAQGVYNIFEKLGERYVVSQAQGLNLLPDEKNIKLPFGGKDGLSLAKFIDMINDIIKEGESK
jgi:hypothetical protein